MPGSSRGALQSPPRYPSTGTVLGALRMLHANRGARLARCPSAGGISRLKEKIKKKEGEKQLKSARCRSGRQVPAQRDGRGSLTVVAAVSPVVGHGAPPAGSVRPGCRSAVRAAGLSGAFIGSRQLHALLRGRRKGWGARAGAEGDRARGRRERAPYNPRPRSRAGPGPVRPGSAGSAPARLEATRGG